MGAHSEEVTLSRHWCGVRKWGSLGKAECQDLKEGAGLACSRPVWLEAGEVGGSVGSCLACPTASLGEDSVSALRDLCHIGQLLMEGPLGC